MEREALVHRPHAKHLAILEFLRNISLNITDFASSDEHVHRRKKNTKRRTKAVEVTRRGSTTRSPPLKRIKARSRKIITGRDVYAVVTNIEKGQLVIMWVRPRKITSLVIPPTWCVEH